MKSVCYIQARGGSKRIPHKNKMIWYGLPFVADAIVKANMTGLFDMIMVSSDDTEILDIARKYGALPVLRSKEMSGDNITDAQLAKEIFKPLKHYDHICCLYPCVPLLTVQDMRSAYSRFFTTETEALRAVDKTGKDAGAFYFFRMTDKPIDTLKYLDYTLEVAQDINTMDDIKEAKRKYENNRLLDR